jgi:hypothetical protein
MRTAAISKDWITLNETGRNKWPMNEVWDDKIQNWQRSESAEHWIVKRLSFNTIWIRLRELISCVFFLEYKGLRKYRTNDIFLIKKYWSSCHHKITIYEAVSVRTIVQAVDVVYDYIITFKKAYFTPMLLHMQATNPIDFWCPLTD